MKRWILVAAAAVLLANCTGATGDRYAGTLGSRYVTGQCFRGNDVNNFNVRDERTVYVSTRRGYVYRLETQNDCFRTGSLSVSIPWFRRGNVGVCVGDETAVQVARWRGGASACLARISGPIADSSISGLRGRQG
jgi:hypothetical protein